MRSDCCAVGVGQTLDAGVVPAAGARDARWPRRTPGCPAARCVSVRPVASHGLDGRAARRGVQVAADEQRAVRRPVLAGQRGDLAALAGVEVVVGLARRRAGLVVARAGCRSRWPGGWSRSRPRRRRWRPAPTARCAAARPAGSAAARAPGAAVRTISRSVPGIVVPDDLVVAVADRRRACSPSSSTMRWLPSWMPTRSGHDVGELLGEERHPVRQVALVAVGGARLAVQDVLAHRRAPSHGVGGARSVRADRRRRRCSRPRAPRSRTSPRASIAKSTPRPDRNLTVRFRSGLSGRPGPGSRRARRTGRGGP